MWRCFELDPGGRRTTPTGTATERLAAKYGMSLERAAQLHAEMTERAAAEGLEFRFDLAARRQHVRRAPHDPPRRDLRAPGRREGAADARVLHRGRGDLRPGDAGPARRRGRRGRRRGARRARSSTASPRTCARTSSSPRSSASRACRSSCSTAATASPARSRPRCCSRPSNGPGARRLVSAREDASSLAAALVARRSPPPPTPPAGSRSPPPAGRTSTRSAPSRTADGVLHVAWHKDGDLFHTAIAAGRQDRRDVADPDRVGGHEDPR